MNSNLVLLLCLFLFVVVTTVDGKVVKESKRKKKPKRKAKLNVNKFKNTMRKAANRQKEKKHQQCAKIVKAARKGDLDILKPGGAPPSDKQRRRMKLDCLDEVGYSPMHHAARKGQIEFLQVLIEMGANTEIENNQAGWTPLQEACYWGQWKVVNVLLNAGANVNHITKKKQNALHVASQGRYGNEGKIVKTLIQAGCKVDQLDEKGWSPLFDAAENGCFDCSEELLKNGASATLKDTKGKTAKEIATTLGFSEIGGLIHRNGGGDDESGGAAANNEEKEESFKDEGVEEVIEL